MMLAPPWRVPMGRLCRSYVSQWFVPTVPCAPQLFVPIVPLAQLVQSRFVPLVPQWFVSTVRT